jgi:hypothetical protein
MDALIAMLAQVSCEEFYHEDEEPEGTPVTSRTSTEDIEDPRAEEDAP